MSGASETTKTVFYPTGQQIFTGIRAGVQTRREDLAFVRIHYGTPDVGSLGYEDDPVVPSFASVLRALNQISGYKGEIAVALRLDDYYFERARRMPVTDPKPERVRASPFPNVKHYKNSPSSVIEQVPTTALPDIEVGYGLYTRYDDKLIRIQEKGNRDAREFFELPDIIDVITGMDPQRTASFVPDFIESIAGNEPDPKPRVFFCEWRTEPAELAKQRLALGYV